MAVAVSSLMTVAILTLAAVCASFISPVFELPAVKTASGYLLPALFGSMALGLFASSSSGSKVVKGGIKGVLPVLIIMTVLSLAARLAGYGSVLGGLVGIFIIVMLPIGILTSYVLWKKGQDPGGGQRAEVKQSERSGSCMVQGSGRFAFIKGAGVTTPHLPKIDK